MSRLHRLCRCRLPDDGAGQYRCPRDQQPGGKCIRRYRSPDPCHPLAHPACPSPVTDSGQCKQTTVTEPNTQVTGRNTLPAYARSKKRGAPLSRPQRLAAAASAPSCSRPTFSAPGSTPTQPKRGRRSSVVKAACQDSTDCTSTALVLGARTGNDPRPRRPLSSRRTSFIPPHQVISAGLRTTLTLQVAACGMPTIFTRNLAPSARRPAVLPTGRNDAGIQRAQESWSARRSKATRAGTLMSCEMRMT